MARFFAVRSALNFAVIDFERLSELCRSVVNFVKLIGEVLANVPSQPGRIGRLPSSYPVARV
jgi:hypothetical protein